LLRDAWHETTVENRFTLHQFLAFSLLLAIGFGEAVTAFEIIYVLAGGRLLELFVAERSRRAIRNMLALSIKDAWVLVDGSELRVPVAELTAGALVVIRSGEKIPVDG
jgi:cation-transporting P-type ATPase C